MRNISLTLLLVSIWFSAIDRLPADDNRVVPLGAALDLVFDFSRQPAIPSRGFIQRTSFRDMLTASERDLQIAFVVDGTDSMGVDITSALATFQGMAADLFQQKGESNVAFNLVLYRDSGAGDRAIELPLGKEFTKSPAELKKAVGEVKTESGAPYFPELIDLGLATAIKELDWSDNATTSRWVIVFGDAPPYEEGFVDKDENTGRRVSTSELIRLAHDYGVQVSAVLCSSGFVGAGAKNNAIFETYRQALPRTRSFMSELTNKTNGVMWDLSDPDIRRALADAARKQRVQTQAFATITPKEVELAQTSSREGSRVRLAILPHMPLEAIVFDPNMAEVQVAAEMRNRFRLVPGLDVADSSKVSDKLAKLTKQPSSPSRLIQQLATGLNVDYVVWGSYEVVDKQITLSSAFYKRVDGSKVEEAVETTSTESSLGQTALVSTVAERLAMKTAAAVKNVDPGTAATLAAVEIDEKVGDAVAAQVSSSPRAAREIWTGFEALEQALAYQKGTPEGIAKLDLAILKLKSASALETGNPFVHSLLANAYFNKAQIDVAEDTVQLFLKALQRAYITREAATHPDIRNEIEADYTLLVEKDTKKAIQLYELLADSTETSLHTAKRAHWMLAGIYCGDWGTPTQFVDPDKAREHIVTILANFSDSPEAAFYKLAFQWDDKDGTKQPSYPKQHSQFTDLAKSDK